MTTAVDTNILLDVLIPDEPFSDSSKKLLDRYIADGRLIVSEIVFAELAAHFPSEEDLKMFLTETGIRLVYSTEKSLHIAGTRWAQYAKRSVKDRLSCGACGHRFQITCPECKAALRRRLHVLADFIIGAHALVNADCLLSRDLGLYKTYFSDLKIVTSVSRN